jgi:uncharacterized protein YodC (DUF2158 family)
MGFDVGDVVQLRGQLVLMTVQRVTETHITTVWFSRNPDWYLQTGTFPEEALTISSV